MRRTWAFGSHFHSRDVCPRLRGYEKSGGETTEKVQAQDNDIEAKDTVALCLTLICDRTQKGYRPLCPQYPSRRVMPSAQYGVWVISHLCIPSNKVQARSASLSSILLHESTIIIRGKDVLPSFVLSVRL
jgi:hypothetical protein